MKTNLAGANFVLGVLVGSVALTSLVSQNRQPPPGILGKVAPPLGVERWINVEKGAKPPNLREFRGKVVYLYCFQSWCPACHSHGFPLLQKMAKRYAGNDDVVFLAVQTVFEGLATNTLANARRVAVGKFKLRIPVGHDPGPKGQRPGLMRRYRTGGTPWTVLIDRNGIVRYNGFGTRMKPADAAERIDALRAEKSLVGSSFGSLASLKFEGDPSRFADHEFTLLRWWTDQCPNCRDSLPALEALRARHDGLEVLGVYHPKPIRQRPFADVKRDARKLRFSGPIAIDAGWELLSDLRRRGLPGDFTSVSLLVDRAGVIRWVHAGPRLHGTLAGRHQKAAADLAELTAVIREGKKPPTGKPGSRPSKR